MLTLRSAMLLTLTKAEWNPHQNSLPKPLGLGPLQFRLPRTLAAGCLQWATRGCHPTSCELCTLYIHFFSCEHSFLFLSCVYARTHSDGLTAACVLRVGIDWRQCVAGLAVRVKRCIVGLHYAREGVSLDVQKYADTSHCLQAVTSASIP